MLPAITPAEPAPAIARPIMRALEDGAEPHTAEPISKRAIATRKIVRVEWDL